MILVVAVLVPKSCLTLATPWTAAHQAPQSMGFLRQEYWSGLPCPPPEDLSNPGREPRSPALQADSLPSEPPGKPNLITEVYEHVLISINITTTHPSQHSPLCQGEVADPKLSTM